MIQYNLVFSSSVCKAIGLPHVLAHDDKQLFLAASVSCMGNDAPSQGQSLILEASPAAAATVKAKQKSLTTDAEGKSN